MKQKRYSEEQIVYALKQLDAGRKASELCRQLGVSEENRELKQLVADLTLDKHILQEVLSKRVWSPQASAS